MYQYLDLLAVISWTLRIRFSIALFFIGLGLYLLIRRLPDLFTILKTPPEKRAENALVFCLLGIFIGLGAFLYWGEKLFRLVFEEQP